TDEPRIRRPGPERAGHLRCIAACRGRRLPDGRGVDPRRRGGADGRRGRHRRRAVGGGAAVNATNETTAKLHNESTPTLADDLSDLAPICDKRDPQCDRAATWYVTARCPIDGCQPRVWLACDCHFAGIDRRRK